MNQIVNAGFDYTQLDKETAGKLKNYAKSGNSLIKRAHVKFIADFGEILSSARQVLANHGNGIFVSWAVAEFEFSKTTIYRYINAWDRCLSIGGYDNVTPTALHRISEESTPQEIRDKVLKLAKKQITVTNADVDVLMPKDCPTVGQTPLHGGNSGEDGRTDSNGKEPQEETAPSESRSDTESAGEGAENSEWEEVEEDDDPLDPFSEAHYTKTPAASAVPEKPPANDEPSKPDPAKVKNLANQYRDKLARAICDYHELTPNRAERDRLVKVVQGVDLW